MTDITHTHLEAAIIDQTVAGAFPGTPYAFVAVIAKDKWQLAVAVANERGYNPINQLFESQAEADEWAEGLNRHIGLSADAKFKIVASTMGGRRVAVEA